jgi:hypothetical protein
MMQMLYRVRSTRDSNISIFIEHVESNYDANRESIKGMLLDRDNRLQHIGADMVNIQPMPYVAENGLLNFFWSVVEDKYFELFCDNAIEVFNGKNDFTDIMYKLIGKRGASMFGIPSARQDSDDVNGMSLLNIFRRASKDDSYQTIVDQLDITSAECDDLEAFGRMGQSSTKDKWEIQKHHLWSFYAMVPVPSNSPLIALAREFVEEYHNQAQQRKFEGLFLPSRLRFKRDKYLDIHRDDTVQDLERECVQYQQLDWLLQTWGISVFEEDTSFNANKAFATSSHSSIMLYEDYGGDIQQLLSQNTYQALLFPKSPLKSASASYSQHKIISTLVALTNNILDLFGLKFKACPGIPQKLACRSLEGMNGVLLSPLFRDEDDNAPPVKKRNITWVLDPTKLADRMVLFAHRLRKAMPMREHVVTSEQIKNLVLHNFPVSRSTV